MFSNIILSAQITWRTLKSRIPFASWGALALMAGITIQAYQATSTWPILPCIIGSMLSVISIQCVTNPAAVSALLSVFIFFGGGAWRYTALQEQRLQTIKALCSGPLQLSGKVLEILHTKKRFSSEIIIELISAHEIRSHKAMILAPGKRIKLKVDGKTDMPCGAVLQIASVSLREPSPEAYAWHLAKQGIYAVGIVPPQNISYHLPSRTKHSSLREQFANDMRHLLSSRTYALFAPMFLGKTVAIMESPLEWRPLFEVWGISHYLARSGLHLVLIAIIIFGILSCFPFPWYYKQIIACLCMIGYLLTSWPTVSFIRAFIMLCWHSICSFIKIPAHALHTIAVTTILVLLYQPLYLFSLDFQLSFGLTLALALLNHATLLENRSRNPIVDSP